MLKKATALVVVLALLLAASQLALAQQAADQQPASTPQSAGEAQASQPNQNQFVRLNANNNLVVDCQALSDGLAALQQTGDTQTTDPQLQSELALDEGLLQLCLDKGFTPVDSGSTAPTTSSPTDTGSTQPQQSGGTPNPTLTSSAEPHQNMDSEILT